MNQQPYLEITYRHGKPFAAYLYLQRREGDKAARTQRHNGWLVDFAVDGRVIGVEFTQVHGGASVDLAELNRLLAESNQTTVISSADLVPLNAA